MGTIVLHAGMPKTGSSSIQHWLADNAGLLRSERDIALMVVRNRVLEGEQHARLSVEEYTSGGANSGGFAAAYLGFNRSPRLLDRFIEGVAGIAGRYPTTVISSEYFAQFFAADRDDDPFLAALDELSRVHPVRVAYYFRPQDACLEALWRQSGFRLPAPPSAFLAEQADQLDYLNTHVAVSERAPHVSFEMRPFRADLLEGGSPVVDFARHFLDAGELLRQAPDQRVNVGLPLELINLLRFAPKGIIDLDIHDGARLRQLQRVFGDVQLPSTPKVARSRAVLAAYCHERFEEGNRALFQRLGRPPVEFIACADVSPWDLAELDDLWCPDASPAELALLYAALGAAAGPRGAGGGP
jgi:hypothetical protein